MRPTMPCALALLTQATFSASHPLAEAPTALKETQGYRVLQGMRGEKRKDIASLVDLLVHMSRLAVRYPHIKEIDLNPVRVYENGYDVLDARILLDGN